MRIVAHRGTRLHAPENSVLAFVSAYTAGADVLELDVQLTADDHLVVSHDGTTDRLTGEPGVLRELTLRQLRWTPQRFDFSHSFNPAGIEGYQYYPVRANGGKRRLQIETLATILDALPDGVPLLVELKHDSSVDAPSREALVRGTVRALGLRGRLGSTVLYSKDPESLRLARGLAGEVRIAAFDWERSPADQVALALDIGADGLVTDVAAVLGPDGGLTAAGERLRGLHADGTLGLGALLYPYRRPGVFTAAEAEALRALPFVWSLSTDSMLGAEVEGEWVDVAGLSDRFWTWVDEPFDGTRVDRDQFSLGYAKANPYAEVHQDDGVHVALRAYDPDDPRQPKAPTGDPVADRLADLEERMLYAEKSWPFYSGGGVGLRTGIRGDFVAEVDYHVAEPMAQATMLEMAVTNVDPGTHQASPPISFRGADAFYDPHGAPPFVGVEHDENDGFRINWNLGNDYDNNQYGPPSGDGSTPRAGRLRLERRGPYFAAYYRNEVDAPDWVCVGAVRNDSMNETVFLRCAGKRWRQEASDGASTYFPILPNEYTFRNLQVLRVAGGPHHPSAHV